MRLMLLIVLSFMATSASAAWTNVGVNKNGVNFYIDTETKTDSSITWLKSYPADQHLVRNSGSRIIFRSEVATSKYGCDALETMDTANALYAEPIGGGEHVLKTKYLVTWTHASADDPVMLAVCGKKSGLEEVSYLGYAKKV